MTNFVKFTDMNGEQIAFNPEHVVAVFDVKPPHHGWDFTYDGPITGINVVGTDRDALVCGAFADVLDALILGMSLATFPYEKHRIDSPKPVYSDEMPF